MPQSRASRPSPIWAAIIVLAVALVAVVILVVVLLWHRGVTRTLPSPSPSAIVSTQSSMPTQSIDETAPPSTPIDPATPEPSPASSTVSSPPPSSTTPSEPAAGQTMMWEGKASFEHFTVELLQDEPGEDTTMIEGKAGLPVEVCVAKSLNGTDAVRVSLEPWTLEDSVGNVQNPQGGGYEPAFPAESQLGVGECVQGFLTFDYASEDSDFANLVYENGLGDRAVWQFH